VSTFGYAHASPLEFVDSLGLDAEFPGLFALTTIEAAKRDISLDQAVARGSLARGFTLPILAAAISPDAVGLVGSGGVAACEASAEGISALSRAFGPRQNWIRLGPSYSKSLKQPIDMSIRWGASPAKGGKYIDQIGSPSLQSINQWLRNQQIPFGGWRSVDPGHFHLW
jgi:hypothetical protein